MLKVSFVIRAPYDITIGKIRKYQRIIKLINKVKQSLGRKAVLNPGNNTYVFETFLVTSIIWSFHVRWLSIRTPKSLEERVRDKGLLLMDRVLFKDILFRAELNNVVIFSEFKDNLFILNHSDILIHSAFINSSNLSRDL